MEKNRNFRYFGIFLVLVTVILSLNFILADPGAPTGLIFNKNSTPTLDEGTFFVNWTEGAGDAAFNYTIFIEGPSNSTAKNDSVTGYTFSDTTEGNYSFIVQAHNITAGEGCAAPGGTGGCANSTENFWMVVDSTAPSVTITKRSSTKTSLDLTLSGTEGTCTVDRSGATIFGDNLLTESSLTCGTSYSYIVTCTDTATNAGSSTSTSFSTDACGGGGSSGTVTPRPKKASYSFSKITPGVATIVKNFDADVGVKEIKIEVNNEAQSVSITVTKHDGKPAAVSIKKSGKVYKYLQIEATNLANKLDKATVTLQVGKSWLSSNSVDANSVALFRFDESAGQWNELVTTYTGSEGDNELYEVELTSFSFFAVGEKSLVDGEDGETGTGREGTRGTADKSGSTLLWIIIVIVVLVLIGWGMKKRKQ